MLQCATHYTDSNGVVVHRPKGMSEKEDNDFMLRNTHFKDTDK